MITTEQADAILSLLDVWPDSDGLYRTPLGRLDIEGVRDAIQDILSPRENREN